MTTTFLTDIDDAWRAVPFAQRLVNLGLISSGDIPYTDPDLSSTRGADFLTYAPNTGGYQLACWGGDSAIPVTQVGYHSPPNAVLITTRGLQPTPHIDLRETASAVYTTKMGTAISGAASRTVFTYFRKK